MPGVLYLSLVSHTFPWFPIPLPSAPLHTFPWYPIPFPVVTFPWCSKPFPGVLYLFLLSPFLGVSNLSLVSYTYSCCHLSLVFQNFPWCPIPFPVVTFPWCSKPFPGVLYLFLLSPFLGVPNLSLVSQTVVCYQNPFIWKFSVVQKQFPPFSKLYLNLILKFWTPIIFIIFVLRYLNLVLFHIICILLESSLKIKCRIPNNCINSTFRVQDDR